MIIKNIKGKVKKVNAEEREFLGKDGSTKVRRRVVNILVVDGDGDFLKLTSFDPSFTLPKEGDLWELPPVRKFECFDGMIQNAMV